MAPPVKEIGAILTSHYDVLLILGLALYELHGPFWPMNSVFGITQTRVQTLIKDVNDRIDERFDQLETKVDDVDDSVQNVEHIQTSHIQATRALCRVNNPRDELDQREIDKYLVKNGIAIEDLMATDDTEENRAPPYHPTYGYQPNPENFTEDE